MIEISIIIVQMKTPQQTDGVCQGVGVNSKN